ncbi:MAG: restriction endonuclease subunit S [Nostoc sp.]|uniref:restriction endonuclease subunit S n=1 Tax=Nostoc sp. TaxID=1180 RepID=UPI002FFA0E3E
MKWLSVPLKVVAPPKVSRQEFESKQIVWHLTLDQIESQTGKIINKQLSPASDAGSSTFLFDNGNVLYSKLRPYLNKVIHPQESGIATTELIPLRPLKNILNEDYLTYYLRSNIFLSFVKQYTTGARMPRVIMDKFWEHYIPLPTVSEQHRIVEILDQANALGRMRAEADAKADRILPALFIKMFGDPATNPMGWDILLVEKLFSRERPGTKCGPFGSALKKYEYVDKGIPVWGIDNIKPNQFVESGSLFITPTKYEELKSYSVEPGDIIISRAGTVGRMCVARPQQSHSIISTNLIRLTLDKKGIFPEYFTSLVSYFPSSVNQLRASGDDGAYSFMNTTILKSLKIPLPPFELQNEYTLRMAEIRRLDAKQIESQTKLNNLFQCLLYRAFTGELTAKWREAHIKELLAEMEEQAKALKLKDNKDSQQLSLL